jgi:ribosome-binding factor A
MTRRLARVNSQLQREITRVLRIEVRDPRVGIPIVTEVRTTPDLAFARVFVRLEGTDKEREQAMKGLAASSGFIRGSLSAELHIRRVPELRFVEDKSLEHAWRIEEILKDILPGDRPGGDGEEA